MSSATDLLIKRNVEYTLLDSNLWTYLNNNFSIAESYCACGVNSNSEAFTSELLENLEIMFHEFLNKG